MIRRLFVCTAVLGWALLLVTGAVEAQCGANPCYTVNPPVYVYLTPAQAAAQGTVTVTIVATVNVSGSVQSHSLAVVPGTPSNPLTVTLQWTSSNPPAPGPQGVSAVLYSQIGNGPVYSQSVGLGGTATWTPTAGDVGATYKTWIVATDSNGSTTHDGVKVMVVGGIGPALVGQDARPENTYVQFNTSGGGGSMAADFVECQAGQIHQCINATHTPFSQVLISNPNTGDSLFHSKHVAGNVAKYNESVSYGDSLCCISVVDEDVLNFREDDEVDCSVAGPVPPPPKHQDVQFGLKITYTWVSALTKANGFHPQAPYCSDASSPPDWPGPFEATANTKSGEYAGAEEMYREVPAGQSFTGVPWSWWFSYISEPYVYPSHPFPPNCTNTDKGFKNGINVFWPLPGMIF